MKGKIVFWIVLFLFPAALACLSFIDAATSFFWFLFWYLASLIVFGPLMIIGRHQYIKTQKLHAIKKEEKPKAEPHDV